MNIKKYNMGGSIDPSKMSEAQKKSYYRKLAAELSAAKKSRYSSVDAQQADINSIEKKLMELKKLMGNNSNG